MYNESQPRRGHEIHDEHQAPMLRLRNIPEGTTKDEIVNFFGNPLSGFILKDNNNEPQIDFDPLNKTATVSFVNVGHAWASMQRRKGAELNGAPVQIGRKLNKEPVCR